MDADKKTIPGKEQSYIHLIQRLSMLLYHTRLYYGVNNPLVKTESSEVLAEIEKNTPKKDPLIFSVLGNTIFLNGEKFEKLDGLSKQFVNNLARLSLGSIDLTPGLTLDELNTFMLLLINNANLKGKDQIKIFLDEHNAKHIIPHLATYQLVQENEQVVKEGQVVDVDKLSSKIIKDFSSDLKHSSTKNKTSAALSKDSEDINSFLFNLQHNVAEVKTPEEVKNLSPDLKDETIKLDSLEQNQPSSEVFNSFSSDLKNGVINDKALVRNPAFLHKALTDLAPTINTFEELLKIIWAIGECLINDISVTKEIETNRNILEQLKNHLFSQYEQKENKEQWKKIIEESFVMIIAALQIKKQLFLYKKHKKGLEVVLKKIKSLLENAPEENKLYQQVKNELKKIGAPKFDINMFT